MRKRCKVCNILKSNSDFYKIFKTKTKNECKTCLKYKIKIKAYRETLKDEYSIIDGTYKCCKCHTRKPLIDFYKSKINKSGVCSYCKKCSWKMQRKSRKNNPNFKIINSMRSRIYFMMKGFTKSKRCIELLGCTAEEWKLYLEKQFKPGMSWENYGTYWEIDHKYPLSVAIEESIEKFNKSLHYTNTQPLTKLDNIRKSNSVINKTGFKTYLK